MIFRCFTAFYGQRSVVVDDFSLLRSLISFMYTVLSKQSLVGIVLMFPLFFITSNSFAFYIIIYNSFILVQTACVCHPWWRTEAKLAIVSTYFFSSFYAFYFSPTSGKLPGVSIPSTLIDV